MSFIKIIAALIIVIIVLSVGLYFAFNGNNTPETSNLNDGGNENVVDEQINSREVNTEDVKYKTVDFNGLFKIGLPAECDFSEISGDTNVGANYTWQNWNSGSSFDSIYYYEGNINLNDVLNKFSASNYETNGNLIIFDHDNRYFVGVQSQDGDFVVLSANNVNDLDNLKNSANSIVFE